MSNILEISEVRKSYEGKVALNDVCLSVSEGDILGLLGPNGAGKTSLIRAITGIASFDSGSISYRNRPISAEDRMKIGYIPEERGLYPDMRVSEQLLYLTQLKGVSKKEAEIMISEWLQRLALEEKKNSRVNDLSKGMQQKVQFISAVAHKPQLLILDEPFSGFDPAAAEMVKAELLRLNREGTTIILSTHDMNSVEELCSHIALIYGGEFILKGNVSLIKADFSSDLFRVRTATAAESLSSPLFEIVSAEKKNGANEILIKKKSDKVNIETLFTELTKQAEIYSFGRDIPSIKDIFFQQIEKQKK